MGDQNLFLVKTTMDKSNNRERDLANFEQIKQTALHRQRDFQEDKTANKLNDLLLNSESYDTMKAISPSPVAMMGSGYEFQETYGTVFHKRSLSKSQIKKGERYIMRRTRVPKSLEKSTKSYWNAANSQ